MGKPSREMDMGAREIEGAGTPGPSGESRLLELSDSEVGREPIDGVPKKDDLGEELEEVMMMSSAEFRLLPTSWPLSVFQWRGVVRRVSFSSAAYARRAIALRERRIESVCQSDLPEYCGTDTGVGLSS